MPNIKPTSHEPFRVSLVGAVVFVAMLCIGAVIMHGVLWDWLRGTKIVAPRWHPAAEVTGPAPRLQWAPEDDWNALREQQISNLHNYSWVDRKRGIARVPIDIAMQQIAAQGLPRLRTNQSVSPLDLQQQRAKGSP
jgi:hypothetical protein